ncbi:MAG: tetratricopeptide repeat protein [Candidatus Omnitrophota bacterium]|jgi:TolA-binding protein
MKKIRFFAVGALLGVMLASCAFRSSGHSFGPYSDAETFYKKGDYPGAIEKYQEYLAGNPQGNLAAIARYYIAKSYIASGDTSKACENFKQVMEQYPQTSWADFAKEQLGMLQGAAKI